MAFAAVVQLVATRRQRSFVLGFLEFAFHRAPLLNRRPVDLLGCLQRRLHRARRDRLQDLCGDRAVDTKASDAIAQTRAVGVSPALVAVGTEASATPHSSSQSKKRSAVWQQPRIVSSDHPRSSRICAAKRATSPAWACCLARGSTSRSTKRSHRTAQPRNLWRASGRAGRLE